MELKLVEVKKAPEERARGESQTPFRKMVNETILSTFSMVRSSRKEGRQLIRFFS
jgi:hypothetical protein